MSRVLSFFKRYRVLWEGLLLIFAFFYLTGTRVGYSVNDDWYYYRQVEEFLRGNLTINARIVPSFIFQGVLGALWSLIFGLPLVSLRYLTLLFAVVSVVYFYRTLLLFNKASKPEGTDFSSRNRNQNVQRVFVFLLVLNPLFLTSVPTFMMDIYSVAIISIFTYHLLLFLINDNFKSFVFALFIASLGFLLRQNLLFLFVMGGTAFLLKANVFGGVKGIFNQSFREINKTLAFDLKFFIKGLSLLLVFLVFSLNVYLLWPRYTNPAVDYSRPRFYHVDQMLDRSLEIFYALPFIIYSLVPLAGYLPPLRILHYGRRKTLYFVVVVAILVWAVLFKYIYRGDIFPLGSVFYLEGLHLKSYKQPGLSIFNNVIFKLLVAGTISYTAIRILKSLFRCVSDNSKQRYAMAGFVLITGIISSVIPLYVSYNIFDRYFLPAIFLLLILFYLYLPVQTGSGRGFYTTAALIVFSLVSLSVNYEYYVVKNIQHRQIEWLKDRGIQAYNIYLDDTYAKFVYSYEDTGFTGLRSLLPDKIYLLCYVQQYTNETAISGLFSKAESLTEKVIANPEILNAKTPRISKNIKKHTDELIYNEMYFSPLYSIIGKKAYVGAWCESTPESL